MHALTRRLHVCYQHRNGYISTLTFDTIMMMMCLSPQEAGLRLNLVEPTTSRVIAFDHWVSSAQTRPNPRKSMRVHIIVVLSLVGMANLVAAVVHVAPHQSCPEESACAVHEVRVDGCRSVRNGVCKVRRGSTPVISFDYTPQFDATSVHGQVYWISPEGDLPFVGMLTDACQHTSCPLASGVRQTYAYNFETSRKYQVVCDDGKVDTLLSIYYKHLLNFAENLRHQVEADQQWIAGALLLFHQNWAGEIMWKPDYAFVHNIGLCLFVHFKNIYARTCVISICNQQNKILATYFQWKIYRKSSDNFIDRCWHIRCVSLVLF